MATTPTMTIEYFTLAGYFGLLILIGGIFARFNRNLSDFTRGGAQCSWWLVGVSSLMAGISAFTFTGNGSAAYDAGPTFLIIYLANILGYAIGAFYLARRYRQSRALTSADVVRARFGPGVEKIYIGVSVLQAPFGAAVQLWSLAVFVHAVFGLPLLPLIVVIGLVTIFYSASGGMWGVMATDVLQGTVLFGVTLLVAALSLHAVGGWAGFFEHWSDPAVAEDFRWIKAEGQFPQNRFTGPWMIVVFIMQLVGQIHLGASSKFLSAKDGREASKAAAFAMGLMALGSVIWFVPPMVARFIYEPLVGAIAIKDPATAAYAVAARELLPKGLMGVMIAAMFSATMSSMDMGMNHLTGIIVRNLVPGLRSRLGWAPLSEQRQVWWCRGITTLLGVLIIGLSLMLAQQSRFILFDAYLFFASIVNFPVFLPLLAGIFIRHLPRWGFLFMMMTAAVPGIVSLAQEHLGGPAWTIQERGGWGLLCFIVALVICLVMARRSPAGYRAREDEFFATINRPVDFAKEVGKDRDAEQASLIGWVICGSGALFLLFLIPGNPFVQRLAIAALATFICGIGGLLVWTARQARARGAAGS
jgi:solute:Na+ symporter, SSS family|uniref:sodium:solute symporter family protein n=2 Tax=Cephaloticoccus sp. TaxID=1985742 RepID=UPI004049B46F